MADPSLREICVRALRDTRLGVLKADIKPADVIRHDLWVE